MIILLIVLLVWFFLIFGTASVFGDIAKEKGFLDSKYFWWSFWLGPVGWMMVIALPDRGGNRAVVAPDELPDL